MKAIINLSETIISNWKKMELSKIKNAKSYYPAIKGYYWYECSKCGTRTKFYVQEGLDDPIEKIGDEIIFSKKTPNKIYCPVCINNYKPNHKSRTNQVAKMDILEYAGNLEKIPGIIKCEPDFVPGPSDNRLINVFNLKKATPVYSEFIDILKE